MKKFLFILLLPSFAFAQTAPVKAKKVSAEEYTELIQRFCRADTSLNAEELQIIYYDFVNRKEYRPAEIVVVENKIRQLNADGESEKSLKLADSLLTYYPVSLVALFEKSYAASLLQLQEQELSSIRRYQALLYTIRQSGDGKTLETAFVIINQNDEFEVIRYFDFTATAYSEISLKGKTFDVLDLKRNKEKQSKIYFDISYPVNQNDQLEVERLKNR
jgi:hypothetical protein